MKQQSFLRKAIFNILSSIRYAMKQYLTWYIDHVCPGAADAAAASARRGPAAGDQTHSHLHRHRRRYSS